MPTNIPWTLILIFILSVAGGIVGVLSTAQTWSPQVIAAALGMGITAGLAILTYHGPAAVSRALGGPK